MRWLTDRLSLLRPRFRTIRTDLAPSVFTERANASFIVGYPSARYLLVNERMRWGAPPAVAYAGRAASAGESATVVVIPMLGAESRDAWWFATVRPVLRADIRRSDQPNGSVLDARLRMNLAGRISFACVVVISAAGLVAAVAGLGARVWPVVAVGAGFFLSGLFAAVVFLVAAGSGTEAGFTALDQWLQEQSQPREA